MCPPSLHFLHTMEWKSSAGNPRGRPEGGSGGSGWLAVAGWLESSGWPTAGSWPVKPGSDLAARPETCPSVAWHGLHACLTCLPACNRKPSLCQTRWGFRPALFASSHLPLSLSLISSPLSLTAYMMRQELWKARKLGSFYFGTKPFACLPACTYHHLVPVSTLCFLSACAFLFFLPFFLPSCLVLPSFCACALLPLPVAGGILYLQKLGQEQSFV